MNDYNQSYGAGAREMDTSVNAGLRAFMLGVYNKLALGIALSGALAFAAGSYEPLTNLLFGTSLRWVVMLAPIAILLFANFGMRRPSPVGSAVLYWAVVIAIGLSMGIYFAMAKVGVGGMSHFVIAKAFLATSITFAGLSLFGYTTKRDLGPIGTFAFMGIWAAFVIGMLFFILPMIFPNVAFLQVGGTMQIIISGAFALFSAVIIAWQTQNLKEGYMQYSNDGAQLAVMTNWGALNFFVSFINILQFFLHIMSSD